MILIYFAQEYFPLMCSVCYNLYNKYHFCLKSQSSLSIFSTCDCTVVVAWINITFFERLQTTSCNCIKWFLLIHLLLFQFLYHFDAVWNYCRKLFFFSFHYSAALLVVNGYITGKSISVLGAVAVEVFAYKLETYFVDGTLCSVIVVFTWVLVELIWMGELSFVWFMMFFFHFGSSRRKIFNRTQWKSRLCIVSGSFGTFLWLKV